MKGIKYIIDTDWVVPFLKGRTEAQTLLNSLTGDGIAISLITYSEIYDGIYFGQDPKRHEQIFLSFLRGAKVIPLNKPIMKQFALFRGQLRGAGQIIGDFDLLIAATATHNQLTLVTRNIKHFERIPGLSLYQPSQSQSQ